MQTDNYFNGVYAFVTKSIKINIIEDPQSILTCIIFPFSTSWISNRGSVVVYYRRVNLLNIYRWFQLILALSLWISKNPIANPSPQSFNSFQKKQRNFIIFDSVRNFLVICDFSEVKKGKYHMWYTFIYFMAKSQPISSQNLCLSSMSVCFVQDIIYHPKDYEPTHEWIYVMSCNKS